MMNDKAVVLEEVDHGIVKITMQDRVYKNGFSDALITGLAEAFARTQEESKNKVIILTGYGPYFSSGGTREKLLALHDGSSQFSDAPLYDLPLRCPIPVVAAMQGHGIGGGFALGLFADFVILSRESVYTTNFMKYGFTPGFGSTCVLRHKLGFALAEEMLMTANSYRGEELERRGVPFPVVPRAEVGERAITLARAIAEKPRTSLAALKEHLTESLRNDLKDAIAKEIAMHGETFHLPQVKERIKSLFGS
jgi:polyketide biosynthesis enoyl-CoA hydratase PksI